MAQMLASHFCHQILDLTPMVKKRDANHLEKGDHSGARFDLCTVYGHIHQHTAASMTVQQIITRIHFRLKSTMTGSRPEY